MNKYPRTLLLSLVLVSSDSPQCNAYRKVSDRSDTSVSDTSFGFRGYALCNVGRFGSLPAIRFPAGDFDIRDRVLKVSFQVQNRRKWIHHFSVREDDTRCDFPGVFQIRNFFQESHVLLIKIDSYQTWVFELRLEHLLGGFRVLLIVQGFMIHSKDEY